jgi:protoporphyrinogen/coproporphyrinogen III oxidase
MDNSVKAAAVVIGGGISGLACAYRLRQLGVETTLLEADVRVGGLIGTAERDGFIFESGPQSFQGTPALLGLIRELGIEGELSKADPRAPRYILRHGRLHKVPMSPQAVLTSSLLGAGARWKILSEPLRKTHPPGEEESIANFVRRKFGHEILEYLVAPFVSGVYAGDPEKLSLRAAFPTLEDWEREYGSILRGAMKSRAAQGVAPDFAKDKGPPPLCSFRAGLGVLTQTLAQRLGGSVRTGMQAEALHRADSPVGGYEIRTVESRRNETIAARAVVLATPAYIASHLTGTLSPPLALTLSGIAYAPAAVVAAGYYARQFARAPEGFGFLVPRSEKYRILGTVWNSSLFPGRAPDGKVAITSFVGGATDPEIVDKPEEEIAAIAEAENARILGITGPPVATAVWKHPKALPQYNLGHAHIVRAIRDAERGIPGLFFAGNYLEGPSLGKCVEQGFQTAEAARAYLLAGT